MRRRIIDAAAATALLTLAAGTTAAQCPGDANKNGFVNFADYGAVAANFGQLCSPDARFVDNLDGTITDRWTGLMWEKMSDDLSIHDKDTGYLWADAAIKVAALNATAFAGYSSWRLPSASELQGLVDHSRENPATFDAFEVNCAPFCTVTTCSCTRTGTESGSGYWTGDSVVSNSNASWAVSFTSGRVEPIDIGNALRVRAVRDVNAPPTLVPTATSTPTPTIPPEPLITFFGLARADDTVVTPSGTTPEGYPIFDRAFGTGFSIVVEGRRGGTNVDIEASTFLWSPGNPTLLPGLQILTSRVLGDGSAAVCDDNEPSLGGVPASPSLEFDGSERTAEGVNDLSCRFKDGSGQRMGRAPDNPCTLSPEGVFRTVSALSNIQFCGLITAATEFPPGDTVVVVRIRDEGGNTSAPSKFVVRVGES